MKGIFNSKWFGWLTLAIIVGYFIVGFWPFDFRPLNRVNWPANQSGLQFGNNGIAYDPIPLAFSESNETNAGAADFSAEIRLAADSEPDDDVFNILTIYNSDLPDDFVFCQWKHEFLFRAAITHPFVHHISEIGISDALPLGKTHFIAIRGGAVGTDLFLDGSPKGHFPGFVLRPNALDGQLILGNDDSGKHSWSGRLFGLALFNRRLDTAEIAAHRELWTSGNARQLTNAPGLTALYLFDEGGGQQVKDLSGNRHRVVIPEIFQPLHRRVLIPPWKDLAYNNTPDYSDIAVNILGFIPFGFCFSIYRRAVAPNRQTTNFLFVMLAGFAISLTIELIQVWLPNRTSSMTDLLTNTTGTLIGVMLAVRCRRFFARKSEA
ncbi:MAG TPA: VanZ family protein [Verrucomicrobiae bacterium]|nr:VanZ family protein [Verrucomicrobiae bacterium]